MDVFPPNYLVLLYWLSDNEVLLTFSEAVELTSSENIANYTLRILRIPIPLSVRKTR